MDSLSTSKSYDAFYFAHSCGRPYQRDEEWLRFFVSIADRIVSEIGPGTVLDAGCAMGFLVEALRDCGVEAAGLDISEYAIQQVRSDVRPYCWVGSLTDHLPRRYDLIVCIEVLEHLSPREAGHAIENLCQSTDDVLFSSTPFDYEEATHVNVQPPDYWAENFARHGLFRDVDFDASFVTPWAVRFRKRRKTFARVITGYERRLWQLDKENQARRKLTIEQRSELARREQETKLLSGESAQKEQVIQALSAQLAKHQEKIGSLNAALSEQREQSLQLLAQSEDRQHGIIQFSAQLTEQYENIQTLLALMAGSQSSVKSLVAQLVEKRHSVEALTSQVEELGEEAAKRARVIETMSAGLAAKEKVAQVLASQVEEKDRTISSLSMRLAKQEQVVDSLFSQVADRDAQLTKITSTMGWRLLTIYGRRIKYPYLLPLYRPYRKIKYPYLLPIYRSLGLMFDDQKKAISEQGQVTQSAQAQPQAALVPPEEFPVMSVPAQAQPQAALVPPAEFPVMGVALPARLEAHQASVDVIVCVHDALNDVKQCLESVVRYTRMPYWLTIVDDGSHEETRDFLARFAISQSVTLIRNERARGYTFAANQGLRQSSADYVVLLNSDTITTPNWLDRMVACGESDQRIGLIGPLSNAASWQSIPEVISNGEFVENKLPKGWTVVNMSTFVAQFSARMYPRVPFLNGFCLMIKRPVIDEIGYFDEIAFGRGYGEENDYCLRARKAGWQLGVADDAYVYHARSRSYSHARRKELSKHADIALRTKHEPQMIIDGVTECRFDRVLEGIRARSRAMIERRQLIETGMKFWEGKEVLFILTLRSPCGGGNVVLDEAEAMRKMGVNARILNLNRNRGVFEQSYPDCAVPVMYLEDQNQIAELMRNFDTVIATANDTVYWLSNSSAAVKHPIKAYYIQDFEPYFHSPETPGFKVAWDSYTAHPDLIRFTKTKWNRDKVQHNTGAESFVVGASVNIDLYRPRKRHDADWPKRPLRIAAMIRPSTPRRNPKLTMEVLRESYRAHSDNIEIVLFGCESSDPQFLELPHNFAWRNAGMLTRPQVAFLLNEVDIFADFSEFQAMGLTAMEAMACGAAVIVPQKGGAESFAAHDQNALIVDTSSPQACVQALERLTLDEALRARLQQQALVDVCKYYPERSAYNILKTIFPVSP